MSSHSKIWIETQATARDVQRILRQTGHFEDLVEFADLVQSSAEGTTLFIDAPSRVDDSARQVGIDADLHLFTSCTDYTLARFWTLNTVRATVALLHEFRGDLLFVYLDIPALMRKGGRIILDRRASLWDEGVEPNVLSLIDLPYEWETIPVA